MIRIGKKPQDRITLVSCPVMSSRYHMTFSEAKSVLVDEIACTIHDSYLRDTTL